VSAHQAEQTAVLTALGMSLLPRFQEVVIDQPNDVETIGHNGRIREVTLGNGAVGLRQVHDHHLNVVTILKTP